MASPSEAQGAGGKGGGGWGPSHSSKRSLGCLLQRPGPSPQGPGSTVGAEVVAELCPRPWPVRGWVPCPRGRSPGLLQGPPARSPPSSGMFQPPCCLGKVSVHAPSLQKLLVREGDQVSTVSLDGPTSSSRRMREEGVKTPVEKQDWRPPPPATEVGIPCHLLANVVLANVAVAGLSLPVGGLSRGGCPGIGVLPPLSVTLSLLTPISSLPEGRAPPPEGEALSSSFVTPLQEGGRWGTLGVLIHPTPSQGHPTVGLSPGSGV